VSQTSEAIDRGTLGPTPALTARADEAFLDFVSDARNVLMHEQWYAVCELANKALATADLAKKEEVWPGKIEEMREVLKGVPEAAVMLRAKRSLQEAYWNRIMDSYGINETEWLAKLDAADKQGPGTLTLNPDFDVPDYAKVEIHIQPGGYVREPLCGLHYDYGTKVFFGGQNDEDALHIKVAKQTSAPKDGKVERLLDIGCAIGQLTCEMKRRFPQAEAWGIDVGAPMLRYAHLRASEQDLDVNFSQMVCEDMDFPDNHFDIVTSHLLFHELPMPVIRNTLAEVYRVLRPGGTFVVWDFPTNTPQEARFALYSLMFDSADNGEPYSTDFVYSGVESLMKATGFSLRYEDPEEVQRHGRVCDKPEENQ
jgi:ubiquinone/menaquinone biosynthesis C-methylase UbiE